MTQEEIKFVENCFRTVTKKNVNEVIDKVYDLVQPHIYFFAYEVLPNKEDAEDVTVEFWDKLQIIARSYRSSNLVAYLRQVVHNMAVTEMRKNKKRKECEVLATTPELEEYLRAHYDYERDERQQALHTSVIKGFGTLEEKEWQMMFLYYWGHCSLRESAKELEISKSSADRILKSAQDKMKIALEEDGWGKDDY